MKFVESGVKHHNPLILLTKIHYNYYCYVKAIFTLILIKTLHNYCLTRLFTRRVLFSPKGFSPRENNIPRVNNYDVHRKCRQYLLYYTETLFTIMLDAINTSVLYFYLVFILCFHKLHICVFNFRSSCNSGMQKRIHFRTDMEHHIDLSTGDQQWCFPGVPIL